MKLEGTYTFEAPRDIVWEALLDPDVLAKALPGTEKLEKVGENDYKGAIKIKVGPIQGQFQGTVVLSDLTPPKTYKMSVNGRGPAGFMKGDGNVRLEMQGDTTVMYYDGDAQVGGRIASVGQRLIDSTSKQITRQALENIHKQIRASYAVEDEAPEAAAPTVPDKASLADETVSASGASKAASVPSPISDFESPSQTQFAFDVARDVLEDLIPAEKRSTILAIALGVVAFFLAVEWWTSHLANRIANILERRR